MKEMNYRVAIVALLACLFLHAVPVNGQNIERVIQDVHNGKKMNAAVTLYGNVTKWDLNKANNTVAYEIQDDWGDKITVISATGQPETHKRYVVTGYVAYDQANSAYQIMETNRVPHTTTAAAPTATPPATPTPVPDTGKSGGGGIPEQTIALILIVVVIVLAVIIFSLWISKSRRTASGFGEDVVVQVSDATQKITIAQPRQEAIDQGTIKLMPGRFDVAGGVDIKEIRLIRPKAIAESDVQYTFGRKPGDPITHIRLDDATVSAEQAILRFDNGQYVLTNKSKVNPTIVNNQPLAVYGNQQLADGDIITMGRVTLTYRSK